MKIISLCIFLVLRVSRSPNGYPVHLPAWIPGTPCPAFVNASTSDSV